jgi:serine/threonine protein phosphatase 1
MGATHTAFLREGLVTHHNEWPFFFCHAGIDRHLPPDAQPERALVHGIRGFRETGGWPDSVVVHGHYITGEPELGSRRIGVDTGAYRSGVLTAVFCIDETIDFIEIEDE